jgi:hypothetical protein
MADTANMAIPSPSAREHISATPNLCHSPATTANVIRALRDGYGVEDIQVMQIADVAYARAVVRKLTDMGQIARLYQGRK